MRKEYGKVLRHVFTERLRDQFPEFEPRRVSSLYVFPGERLFRWVPEEPLHCWIILSPDPKGRESFRLEIGWSVHSRFPELSMRPTPIDPSDFAAAAARTECVIRASCLRDSTDKSWDLPDPALVAAEAAVSTEDYLAALRKSLEPISPGQALADVSPHVEDALALLREYGVPFLQRLAAHHGSTRRA